jgi:hypothetical protein
MKINALLPKNVQKYESSIFGTPVLVIGTSAAKVA